MLVPIPWFLDDYDLAWAALKHLYLLVQSNVQVYVAYPSLQKLITVLLLFPVAVGTTLRQNCTLFFFLAVFYAQDAVLWTFGDYARNEAHESECDYYHVSAEDIIEKKRQEKEEAERPYRERHPDKGHSDNALVLLSSTTEKSVEVDPNSADALFSRACGDLLSAACQFLESLSHQLRIDRYLRNVHHIYNDQSTVFIEGTICLALLIYGVATLIICGNWRPIYGNRRRPTVIFALIAIAISACGLYTIIHNCLPKRLFEVITKYEQTYEMLRNFPPAIAAAQVVIYQL